MVAFCETMKTSYVEKLLVYLFVLQKENALNHETIMWQFQAYRAVLYNSIGNILWINVFRNIPKSRLSDALAGRGSLLKVIAPV